MKALLDLFKQVQTNETFDAIKIGLASPEKIRSLGLNVELDMRDVEEESGRAEAELAPPQEAAE